GDDGAEDARKAAAAAAVTGTPLRVSVAPSLRGLAADLRRRGLDAECEEASVLEPRLASGARLRLVGGPEPATLAAAARAGVAVLDEPVCSHGRIELVRWLREQTLSRSLHRYGNVVY
ncbi:MAG: hypothetical protein ACRDYB_08215, partial [Acidimicrobiales bacterium]